MDIHRRQTRSAAAAVGFAIAAVVFSSNVALADSGSTVTHFVAQYSFDAGPPIGQVSFDCSGDRIVKTAPKPVVKDSEVCTTAAALLRAGTYSLPDGFNAATGWNGWASDYEAVAWAGPYTNPPCNGTPPITFCARVATSGSITVTQSKNTGLYTWDIAAYYAP
jgi:hypothetical protein